MIVLRTPPSNEAGDNLEMPGHKPPPKFQARGFSTAEEVQNYQATEAVNDKFFHREDSINGLRSLRDWQACWLRAIGLIWKEPKLKGELEKDPRAFFKKHCQYVFPQTMHIEVKDDPGSKWMHDSSGSAWIARPNVLTVFLPQPPPDSKDWAVALADFEAIGTLMPFSFCCC